MRKIIFNWYYDRRDLTEYILQIFGDTRLYFLYHAKEQPVPEYLQKHSNVSVIYWNDFTTPYGLIKSINPDAIVFHDIESFHQVGLNIAAKNLSIVTFILQHGLRTYYDVQYLFENNYSRLNVGLSGTSFKTMRFFLSSLRMKNFSQMPSLIKFIFYRKIYDLTIALKKSQFSLRTADYYIELSEINTTFHKERDNIPDEKFIITGNPLFDGYVDSLNKAIGSHKEENYVLLVDCPFECDNGIDIPLFSLEQKNDYLKQIAKLAGEENYLLKVKLHPKSYGTKGLVTDPNLIYCRDEDIIELAKTANYVIFVHYSSVTPVLLGYKKCIYIDLGGDVQRKLFEMVGVEGYSLNNLLNTKTRLGEIATVVSLEKLDKLLFKIDGRSAERVRNAIVQKIEMHKSKNKLTG